MQPYLTVARYPCIPVYPPKRNTITTIAPVQSPYGVPLGMVSQVFAPTYLLTQPVLPACLQPRLL